MMRDTTHLLALAEGCHRCGDMAAQTWPDMDDDGVITRMLCAECCRDLGKEPPCDEE